MKRIWIFVTLLGLVSCAGRRTGNSSVQEKIPAKVSVITIEPQENVSINTYVGEVKASKRVSLTAKYPGTVSKLLVSEGSVVKKGEAIAVVFSQTVNSSLETAVATFSLAKDGLERAEKVYASGSISEQKMVSVRSDYKKAEAAYKAALSAKEECTVTAPFDGVVSSVAVVLNESVNPLSVIATMLDAENLEIEISVPEKEIADLKAGSRLNYTVAALQDGLLHEGEIRSKAVVSSLLTHTYTCTLALPKVPKGLLPGMICNVMAPCGAQEMVIIPSTIIRTDAVGRYVWKVDDGVVRRQYITVGPYKGEGVVIQEGLKKGDLVISSGCQKYSEGEKVVIDGA